MKNKYRWGKYLLSLLLSLCIVGGMIPVMSMANGLSGDATLQSLSYHINGGEAIPVPNFNPDDYFFSVTLPRSIPRDAEITLSGVCTNEKASITKNTGIKLENGVAESTADIAVTAEDGTENFYFVYLQIESIRADMQDAAVDGIEAGKAFLQNEKPVFTAIGSGMENANPFILDERYRPGSWKIDDGAVLSGNWDGAPYTAVLELSKLSVGTHTLTVMYELERFHGDEYGWELIQQDMPEESSIIVHFSVAKAPAATHTVNFDSCGGSAVSPLTNVSAGTTIAAPGAPVKDGFTFGGWYKDTDCTDVWNFDADVVTADITLYAKWHIEETTTKDNGSEETTTEGNGSEETTTEDNGSEETTTKGNGSEKPNPDGNGSGDDKNSGKGNAEGNANSGGGSESGSNPKTGARGLPAVIPLLAIASCITGCFSIRRRRNTQ